MYELANTLFFVTSSLCGGKFRKTVKGLKYNKRMNLSHDCHIPSVYKGTYTTNSSNKGKFYP